MSKHTPQIAVMAARRRLDTAYECCPHWDYENPNGSTGDCCRELGHARAELKDALRDRT